MPHGLCLLWDAHLITVYIVGHALTALAYYAIPIGIFLIGTKESNVNIRPSLFLFGLFIALCGTGHLIDIVVLWYPAYWFQAIWGMATGLVSILTAYLMLPELRKYLKKRQVGQ